MALLNSRWCPTDGMTSSSCPAGWIWLDRLGHKMTRRSSWLDPRQKQHCMSEKKRPTNSEKNTTDLCSMATFHGYISDISASTLARAWRTSSAENARL